MALVPDTEPPATGPELWQAYRNSGLRRLRISYQTAVMDTLLRRTLEHQIFAARKKQQHPQGVRRGCLEGVLAPAGGTADESSTTHAGRTTC